MSHKNSVLLDIKYWFKSVFDALKASHIMGRQVHFSTSPLHKAGYGPVATST